MINTVISYREGGPLDTAQVIDLYVRSILGERRPVDRPETFDKMLRHANLILTAWDGPRLVGRPITPMWLIWPIWRWTRLISVRASAGG